MRIIAGSARGKVLEALPGEDVTRPTIDRDKEAMFSSVQYLVPGARVLDWFAGSGPRGLEALSRGANSCTFVDRAEDAIRVITSNCKAARVDRQASIRHSEALSFLATARGPFDLVLLDPPYHHDTLQEVLPALEHCVAQGGVVLCESEAEAELRDPVGARHLHQV